MPGAIERMGMAIDERNVADQRVVERVDRSQARGPDRIDPFEPDPLHHRAHGFGADLGGGGVVDRQQVGDGDIRHIRGRQIAGWEALHRHGIIAGVHETMLNPDPAGGNRVDPVGVDAVDRRPVVQNFEAVTHDIRAMADRSVPSARITEDRPVQTHVAAIGQPDHAAVKPVEVEDRTVPVDMSMAGDRNSRGAGGVDEARALRPGALGAAEGFRLIRRLNDRATREMQTTAGTQMEIAGPIQAGAEPERVEGRIGRDTVDGTLQGGGLRTDRVGRNAEHGGIGHPGPGRVGLRRVEREQQKPDPVGFKDEMRVARERECQRPILPLQIDPEPGWVKPGDGMLALDANGDPVRTVVRRRVDEVDRDVELRVANDPERVAVEADEKLISRRQVIGWKRVVVVLHRPDQRRSSTPGESGPPLTQNTGMLRSDS
jgi:hypothetical protein